MKSSELNILSGENSCQKASLETNDKMVDYESSSQLSYINILSILKGLDVVSEFYDVKCACSLKGTGICAVALAESVPSAVEKVIDSNPIDFVSGVIVISAEVDSETAKFIKKTNIIVAPKYTKQAIEYFETYGITYVTINTPLKDYKKYLSNETKITPLGTLTQTPNNSELNKETFKVMSKQKPATEQVEDAVFAWKVAKHNNSQALIIAKDLKTTAISQGLQSASIEFALDYSCDMSKDAILASDMPLTLHDIDVAAQGRIALIIVPFAEKDIIERVDKYSMSLITTGITNILY